MVNTMNRNRKISYLLILFLIFGGCISLKQPSRKIEHYTLEYKSKQFANLQPLPFILRVDRFQVAPPYNTNNIIYKEKEFKRDAYIYRKWKANPGDFFTYFIARDLKESSLFTGVFTLGSKVQSSHVIEGTVDEFFELDGKKHWEAVLSVNITLIADNKKNADKIVLFQKKYNAKEA